MTYKKLTLKGVGDSGLKELAFINMEHVRAVVGLQDGGSRLLFGLNRGEFLDVKESRFDIVGEDTHEDQ